MGLFDKFGQKGQWMDWPYATIFSFNWVIQKRGCPWFAPPEPQLHGFFIILELSLIFKVNKSLKTDGENTVRFVQCIRGYCSCSAILSLNENESALLSLRTLFVEKGTRSGIFSSANCNATGTFNNLTHTLSSVIVLLLCLT